jgi:hypothetical protein
MTILHLLRHLLIEEEGSESGYDGEVLKSFSRFPRFVESWLLTLGKRTLVTFPPRASITAAAVDATINVLRLEARQSCNLLLNLEQRSKVPKVLRERMAQGFISLSGESIVDMVVEGADVSVISIIKIFR